ncbi:MAG: hypothetical protein KBA06_05195, partial [Saprospiraceae bacterium]|nr:hypothetical protein [Saprospiraceae bacterium]
MQPLLLIYVFLPFIGFIISLTFDNSKENTISGIAIGTSAIQTLLSLGIFINWVSSDCQSITYHIIDIYKSPEFSFGVSLY